MPKTTTPPNGWTTVKLRDVADKCTAKNSGFKHSLVLTNSAKHGVIPQSEHFDKDIAVDEKIDGYFVVHDNEFVYNPRISITAPCGPIRRNHLGATGVISPLYTIFKLKEGKVYDKYAEHYFLSSAWHKYAKRMANHVARHDRTPILDGDFFSMPIPLPPLAEQRRIAEILAAEDSVIALKQRLIDAKKQQKRWLIQTLLNGKRQIQLQSVCDTFRDGAWIESKDRSDSGIRLIQTSNIGVGQFSDKVERSRYISEDAFTRLNRASVQIGDVLVSRLPNPAGRACIVPNIGQKMITVVDCTIIRFRSYNPIVFVGYTQTAQYQNQIDILLAGSTHQRISRSELGKIKIPVLTDAEQTAIAERLAIADREIELLALELDQQKLFKKGLTQQLLTGKLRVKEATAA
jgi:type I restriction enzyme S subunit